MTEHPFAQYVRILGKGPNLSRAMTAEETEAAVSMIIKGEVEPVQLGAFLTLMRVKTETPEEVTGFVRAAKASMSVPDNAPAVDLDWASYAGKSRQLPWYLFSALLLAQNGTKVFMHGADGHTPDRIYARQVFEALGVPVATSMDEAVAQINAGNFAFMPLEFLSPRLHEIMELKPLLGVRSPVHTIARKLNPFDAPAQILSVAHPAYRDVHQEAALLLGQPHMCVFKGDGGEAERRPSKPCRVYSVHDGALSDEMWPPLADSPASLQDETMDVARMMPVWTGAQEDDYAAQTVIGSAAIALRLMGKAGSVGDADAKAKAMWDARDKTTLLKSAS